MKVRYVVYAPKNLEDAAGGFKRARQFDDKRAAISWAKQQRGVMGGGYGGGFVVEEETVDDQGRYHTQEVWSKL